MVVAVEVAGVGVGGVPGEFVDLAGVEGGVLVAVDDGFELFLEVGEEVAVVAEFVFAVFEPVVDVFGFAVFVGALAAGVGAVFAGAAVFVLVDGGLAPAAVALVAGMSFCHVTQR